jgi:single-strand DNA-binding protein
MGNVNKVILIGYLGADPEVKRTPAGQGYCHLSVATNMVFKDQAGQRQQKTEWHRITVWGEQAEHCAQYLKKGSSVYVEGRLETRSWEEAGKKRYATDVIAIRVEFLDPAGRQAA